MQGIYNYMLETNHVSRVYSVTAVLYLLSVLHVMLFRQWNKLCTLTLAPSTVCVQCPTLFFWLQFLNFELSWYVAQVLPELFWNGSRRLYYKWYHFCFHIPHAVNFYYEIFLFYINIIITLLLSQTILSRYFSWTKSDSHRSGCSHFRMMWCS